MDLVGCDQCIEAIATAKTNKELKEVITTAIRIHGYERWLYASDNPYGRLGIPTTLGNEFGKWLLIYMAKGYQRIDPIVAYCRASTKPLLWDPKVGWEAASEEVQTFMSNVAAHGFGSAVAVPLREPDGPLGVLSVASAAPLCVARPHFEETLPSLVQLGQMIHRRMIKLMKENARLQKKIQY